MCIFLLMCTVKQVEDEMIFKRQKSQMRNVKQKSHSSAFYIYLHRYRVYLQLCSLSSWNPQWLFSWAVKRQ